MSTSMVRSSVSTAVRYKLMVLAGFAGLAAESARADQPVAVGVVRNAENAPWGRLEIYQGGKLNFYLRFVYNGNQGAMTVMPDTISADGRITCKFINYDVYGATLSDLSDGRWVENGGGDLILDAANADATGLNGTMAYTYQGTQNVERIPIDVPQWVGIRLTEQ
jgi:hypothetical protein